MQLNCQVQTTNLSGFPERKKMFYYDIKESGKRIKELRKAKGLTQEKLSEKIGISCQGLKMIECGINGARIDTFVYLAEVLDTTIDYLVLGRSCMVIDDE